MKGVEYALANLSHREKLISKVKSQTMTLHLNGEKGDSANRVTRMGSARQFIWVRFCTFPVAHTIPLPRSPRSPHGALNHIVLRVHSLSTVIALALSLKAGFLSCTLITLQRWVGAGVEGWHRQAGSVRYLCSWHWLSSSLSDLSLRLASLLGLSQLQGTSAFPLTSQCVSQASWEHWHPNKSSGLRTGPPGHTLPLPPRWNGGEGEPRLSFPFGKVKIRTSLHPPGPRSSSRVHTITPGVWHDDAVLEIPSQSQIYKTNRKTGPWPRPARTGHQMSQSSTCCGETLVSLTAPCFKMTFAMFSDFTNKYMFFATKKNVGEKKAKNRWKQQVPIFVVVSTCRHVSVTCKPT